MATEEDLCEILRKDDADALEELLYVSLEVDDHFPVPSNCEHPELFRDSPSILCAACYFKSLKCVKLLLSFSADVNYQDGYDRQPILFAVAGGSLPVIQFLLENGASLTSTDRSGNGVVHYMVLYKRKALLLWFSMTNAISLSPRNSGLVTPLHLAAMDQLPDYVKLLCDNGADVDAQTSTGATPLHYACLKPNLETVRILYEKVKISHSSSYAFSGSVYDKTDARRILTEFEANGVYDETSDGLKEISDGEGHENASFLVLSGVRDQKSSVWRELAEQAQLVSIPDDIEELGTYYFRDCDKLLRVTFGESSSVKLIGADAFLNTPVREIHIPDSVEKLVAGCFRHCYHLSRVTFGESSSLKRIGMAAFDSSGVSEIHIPDSVEELAEECFLGCHSLSRVTFGGSSALKQIGCSAFRQSRLSSFSLPASVTSVGGSSFSECRLKDFVISDDNPFFTVFARILLSNDKRICYGIIGKVEEVTIPDCVEELCGWCFFRCFRLSHVIFGESSSLKRFGIETFADSGLTDIHIPDGVEEISDQCFCRCRNLERVTFGASSSLKRIGRDAFSASGLEEIHIPDGVETLGDSCLDLCRDLPRVTFGKSSLLKVIGIQTFCQSGLIDIHIPDGVEILPKKCFICCARLSSVTFGASSSLKRIDDEAFARSGLKEIHIPDGVEELCKKCFFRCESLSRVTFGESSLLKVIGKKAFCQSGLTEIHIPNGVEVLCDRCRALQTQSMH